MMGYSKRPLWQKLGIKEGMIVTLLNEPKYFLSLLEPITQHIVVSHQLNKNSQYIHLFVEKKIVLEKKLPICVHSLSPSGLLWVSWPKRTSQMPTDITENVIRDVGILNGVVDVKVCAIDETWSGLKFVFRLKDRD